MKDFEWWEWDRTVKCPACEVYMEAAPAETGEPVTLTCPECKATEVRP